MLSQVAGLSADEADKTAADLAPLAGGDTMTLVTDWVFWSQLAEDDRPPFDEFQRYAVFESWEA